MNALGEEAICRRSLTYRSGGTESDVEILLGRPMPDPDNPQDAFLCRFAITGLPEELEGHAAGVDAMQALICALQGIRSKLAPFADSLFYLDGPYDESAEIVIGGIDPGRRRRIIEVLDEEAYAQQRLYEMRKDAVEAVRQRRAERDRSEI